MSEIGKELFALVQEAQGRAYLSDAVEYLEDDEVIHYARVALKFTEKTTRLLRKFLKKYEGQHD